MGKFYWMPGSRERWKKLLYGGKKEGDIFESIAFFMSRIKLFAYDQMPQDNPQYDAKTIRREIHPLLYDHRKVT